MSLAVLPTVLCRRGGAGPVEANPAHPGWQGIDPVSLAENLGGGPPLYGTRVRTMHDGEQWRVLFEVDDPAPWATLTARDSALWTEEVVEVFFDPVGDG